MKKKKKYYFKQGRLLPRFARFLSKNLYLQQTYHFLHDIAQIILIHPYTNPINHFLAFNSWLTGTNNLVSKNNFIKNVERARGRGV